MSSNTEIQFKWEGKNVLKGYIGTAYVTTVSINDMPYKYAWDGDMLRFGQGNEAYAIKRDELPKALSEYFDKHDFVNYDVNDLWLEIGYDNLVAWHC